MLKNLEAYKIWAPPTSYWSQWAKPILFTGTEDPHLYNIEKSFMDLPEEMNTLDSNTAIIIDLPGKLGVLKGLALANVGYRPIPLYNGVHESQIGELQPALQNAEIAAALISGADYLKPLPIGVNASPVFLLDSNRDKPMTENSNLYDNRWSLDFEDMPQAAQLANFSINRVVVWADKAIGEDVSPILAAYRASGVQVFTYIGGAFFPYDESTAQPEPMPRRFRRRVFRRRGWRGRWDRFVANCYGENYLNPGYNGNYDSGYSGYKGYGGYGGTGSGGYSGKGYGGYRSGFGGGYGG